MEWTELLKQKLIISITRDLCELSSDGHDIPWTNLEIIHKMADAAILVLDAVGIAEHEYIERYIK